MKKVKHLLIIVLSVVLLLSVVGCGQENTALGERVDVTVLTYGSGGSNYIQAGGMVKVIEKGIENYVATVQPTGGDVEMVRLLDQGEGDFAFVMINSAYQAYTGEEPFEGACPELRTFLVGQNAMMHLVVLADSPIKTVEDLKGKRVAVGPPGSSCSNYMAPRILDAYGMSINDIKAQEISINDTTAALMDGTLDAGFFYLIPPAPALVDLSSTHPIRLLPITPKAQSSMTANDSLLDFELISESTYPGMESDTNAVGLSCVILTHADVPNEVIYNIAKALDEGMDTWIEVHYGAEFYTPEKTAKFASVMPIHDGMLQYLKEKGVSTD